MEYRGYFPGVIGKVIELHATYYYENWALDLSFETQVGRELSDFMRGFREGRDFFRVAMVDGDLAGAVAIDGGHDPQTGVRLRWFIVEPRFQGSGIGTGLLDQAMTFATGAGYKRVYLWTFRGLDAARCLYERAGFRLMQERAVTQWGRQLQEQMFEIFF